MMFYLQFTSVRYVAIYIIINTLSKRKKVWRLDIGTRLAITLLITSTLPFALEKGALEEFERISCNEQSVRISICPISY